MLEISERTHEVKPEKVCLCGIGSAGTKILEEVFRQADGNVSLCVMDLDARQLNESSVPCKIHLGAQLTRGLGSGGDAQLGSRAAKESADSLIRFLDGASLTVLVAGLGGGTGSGVAPELARLAKELGSFVVSLLIRPFPFEGKNRLKQAEEAREQLSLYSDLVLNFDNESMDELTSESRNVIDAFRQTNSLLARAALIVPSLSRTRGSLLSVGVADVLKVVGTGKGICSFGIGKIHVDEDLESLTEQVKRSPLFLSHGVDHAKEFLILLKGGTQLTLRKLEEIIQMIGSSLGGKAVLHFGASVDEAWNNQLELIVLGAIPDKSLPIFISRETETIPEKKEIKHLDITKEASVMTETIVEECIEKESQPPELPRERKELDFLTKEISPAKKNLSDDDNLEVELEPFSSVASDEIDEEPVDEEREALEEPNNDEAQQEVESDPVSEEKKRSAITFLEEGDTPGDRYGSDSDRGVFSRVRPIFLDGEDLDLPPSLRKKKSDFS